MDLKIEKRFSKQNFGKKVLQFDNKSIFRSFRQLSSNCGTFPNVSNTWNFIGQGLKRKSTGTVLKICRTYLFAKFQIHNSKTLSLFDSVCRIFMKQRAARQNH